jgi:hypothetical protein
LRERVREEGVRVDARRGGLVRGVFLERRRGEVAGEKEKRKRGRWGIGELTDS